VFPGYMVELRQGGISDNRAIFRRLKTTVNYVMASTMSPAFGIQAGMGWAVWRKGVSSGGYDASEERMALGPAIT
jgi:hypothetical protein